MSKERGELGVFGALAIVLVVMGIVALIANFFGILPKY
jgi:hypothetical protein